MGGRQRRVPGGRSEVVKVRLTAEQKVVLDAKADELSVSVPRLLVDSALTPAGMSLPERHALWTELEGISRLLTRVGTNVNQIAAAMHATGTIRPEVAGAADAVTRIADRLRELLDELPAAPGAKVADR